MSAHALTGEVNRNHSRARCPMEAAGWPYCNLVCPKHTPKAYALRLAKHRKVSLAEAFRQVSDGLSRVQRPR